ncbi:Zinc finger CCCH domain-containing protein 7 [Auxenochlorella protothecoides]|uniref:Zinc finger CCCH domain-containing protein 7 n=1 Tax=Auxenochlorella protothecoides TaxID=3075 RepID=A0A087SU96_AUXPR|nr:Zinc finger CCCH domain-containing protein 7 [Auxenochlorella protothecoides]KFM29300.1 Zinc finger CCCH domain-containing protein 7 [Auxenochlorella protothecoides]
MCTRGAACKYSHSVDHIIAVNSEEKGICFDFLKGLCNRGLMCRFSHDLTNLQAPQESGNGRRRFAPICYDFVKNQCTRGDACRYSHDYASILYGPRGAGKQLNVLCVDYTRGRCLRGDACRYLHPAPAAYGGPASLEAVPAVPAPGFDPGYDLVMAQLQGLSLAGQEAAPSGRHPQAGLYEAAVLQSMLLQQRFGAAGPEARSGGFQGTAHAAPGAAAFAQGGPGASLPSGFLSSTSRGGYTAPQAHRIKQLPRAMEQLLAGEAGEDLSPTIPAGWYDPTPEQRAGASPAPEPAAPDLAPIFTRAAEDGAARSGGATPVDGARSTTQRGGSGDDRAGLELLQSIWAIHGA